MTTYAPGGWVDSTVPDIMDLLDGLELDREAFSAWLGRELAEVRFAHNLKAGDDVSAPWPTLSEEVAALDRYINALEAITQWQPSSLPPIAQAHIDAEAGKRQMDAATMMHTMMMDARTMLALAHGARRKLQDALDRHPPRRGRPAGAMTARDLLLGRIVKRLHAAGCTAAEARQRAETILVRSGIPAPAGERSTRRATRRGDNNSR
jgi:hypothetical protein